MEDSTYTDKLKHVPTCFQMHVMDAVPKFNYLIIRMSTSICIFSIICKNTQPVAMWDSSLNETHMR
jgi:hypothetical protein